MKSILRLVVFLFSLCFLTPGVRAQANDPAPQPIPVTLVQGINNSVQLGIEVNGKFAYPFTFTANPQLKDGLTLSSGGLISGTPAKTDDQPTQITVKDSNGTQIAQYSVVLKVAGSMTVLLTTGPAASAPATPASASPTSSAAKTSATSSAYSLSTNPIYAYGDTITGAIKQSQKNTAQQGQGLNNAAANGGSATLKPVSAGSDTAADTSGNNLSGKASDGTAGKGSDKAGTQQDLSGTIVTIKCKAYGETATHSGCDPNLTATATTAADGSFSYQFHNALLDGDQVEVSLESGAKQTNVVQSAPAFFGEETRAIVGYQQAGASSSSFTQNWFVDFFVTRPMAFHKKWAEDCTTSRWWGAECGKLRWWGNVRIASFPQPGNQSLAELAAGMSAQLGALKMNQLAQGAEFLTGPEFQLFKSRPFRGFSENTHQAFTLGLIGAFGATGFFSAPSQNLQVFDVPASGSPQYTTFIKAFPGVTTPYVAFISPDVERFPKEYLGGFRLETHYFDPTGKPLTSPPAMVSFTVGQNQVVTADQLRGVVGRFEAFYPMPFGNRGETKSGAFSSVYFFGTAQLRLGHMVTAPPLALAPAATGVNASDPTVTLVPLPNTRDLYRFGFGVDLVGFVSSLTGGTSKASTTGQSGNSQTDGTDKTKQTIPPAQAGSTAQQNPTSPNNGAPADVKK